MGKRTAIAILGVAVIGWLGYALCKPHPDTVEYHLQRYTEESKWDGLEHWLDKRAPDVVRDLNAGELLERRRMKRFEEHRDALVRLGFLGRNRIVVSNASHVDVIGRAIWYNGKNGGNATSRYFFWWVEPSATNVIHVIGTPDEAQRWTAAIGWADYAEPQ